MPKFKGNWKMFINVNTGHCQPGLFHAHLPRTAAEDTILGINRQKFKWKEHGFGYKTN